MALALQGVGIARLADWAAAPEIARGTLVQVCPGYTATSAQGASPQMHAVYASRTLPARARAMLAAIRECAEDLQAPKQQGRPTPPGNPGQRRPA